MTNIDIKTPRFINVEFKIELIKHLMYTEQIGKNGDTGIGLQDGRKNSTRL